MCGSVDMSYACLSVCLSLSAFLWYFFLGFFLHISTQLNAVAAKKCEARQSVLHICVCVCAKCVCIGCKLKRSSSHTKTTTRTSALMLHLPCLFTASCPFVGHTHINTYTHGPHMCENGFYFNPFFLFSFGVCPADCVLCAAHPSALIAFDCSALLYPLLFLSRSHTMFLLSLSSVLCLFVVLLIYAINWHNLWPIVQAKNKNIAEFTL